MWTGSCHSVLLLLTSCRATQHSSHYVLREICFFYVVYKCHESGLPVPCATVAGIEGNTASLPEIWLDQVR